MANWFGKKPQPEKSPAGTIINRYDTLSAAPFGVTGESTAGFPQAREEVYKRLFGEAESVSHEVLPLIPHIDIYTYYRRANDGSRTCILVTGGMSDVEMNLPAGAKAPRRVELIFYCTEPKQEYINTMRWLAHFPTTKRHSSAPVTPSLMEIRPLPFSVARYWTLSSCSRPSSRRTKASRTN